VRNELFARVKDIVKAVFEKNHKGLQCVITEDSMLRDDIGLDSIDLSILQIELEDNFGIRFDPFEDDFTEIFLCVRQLCRTLERKIGEKNGI